MDELTIDIHSDGLDSWGTKAILSLAVITTPLCSLDLSNVQSVIEHTGVLEAI